MDHFILRENEDFWVNEIIQHHDLETLVRQLSTPKRSEQKSQRLVLDATRSAELRRLCGNDELNIFAFFLSAWAMMYRLYDGRNQFSVITNGMSEKSGGLTPLMFVNLTLNATETFRSVFDNVRGELIRLSSRQYFEYGNVVDHLQARGVSCDAYQMMFNYQTATQPNVSAGIGVNVSTSGSFFTIDVSADMDSGKVANDLATTYDSLLNQIISDPRKEVRDYQYMPSEIIDQLLSSFGCNPYSGGDGKFVVDLFTDQVSTNPDKVAVVCNNISLTYRVIDELSNDVCHSLVNLNIGEGCIVGVLLGRSEKIIVTLLGIFKAGAAYLPIDPIYPDERIRFCIDDSALSLLITESGFRHLVKPHVPILLLDNLHPRHDAYHHSPTNVVEQIAYIIYTSGSTGKPKGVVISHRSLSHFIAWAQSTFDVHSFDTVFFSTSYCFDLSVFEIFCTLSLGKTVTVLQSALEIGALLRREKSVLLNTVPSVVNNLLESQPCLDSVSILNMAGEPIPPSLIRKLDAQKIEIRNLYGPSEDTTYSVGYKFSGDETDVFIGTPIADKKVYILNDSLELLPPGVPGELCIAGKGLAVGYLNNVELTNSKFIPNPFRDGERLYRTGDFARWTEGNLQFLGRRDQQVKVRGFRIELGEIESVLMHQTDVEQAIAEVITNDGLPHILAFYQASKEIDIDDIANFVKGQLPHYMLPSRYVRVDAFPVNSNGKIDRKVLVKNFRFNRTMELPANALEAEILEVWRDVLNKKDIGTNEGIFELGGNSLAAYQIVFKLGEKLGADVQLSKLLSNITVRELAMLIGESKRLTTTIKAIEEQEYYTVSEAQRQQWMASQRAEEHVAYNMSHALWIEGDLSPERLQKAVEYTLKKHHALRATFLTINGELKQKYFRDEHFKFEVDIVHVNGTIQVEQILANERRFLFDLERGPLWRVKLLRLANDKHIFVFTIDHILCDGWSLAILTNEIVRNYGGENRHERGSALQYKDYTAWHNHRLRSGQLNEQKDYWLRKLKSPAFDRTDMPRDPSLGRRKNYRGREIRISIDELQGLKSLSHTIGASLYVTVLSAVNMLVHRLTGSKRVTLGSVLNGRNTAAFENVVGLFFNVLPIEVTYEANSTALDILKATRQSFLEAIDHQEYPFVRLTRDMAEGTGQLFDVLVVQQNQLNVNYRVPDSGIVVNEYKQQSETSLYDMVFHVTDSRNSLTVDLTFNDDAYNESTGHNIAGIFRSIIAGISGAPHEVVDNISLIGEETSSFMERISPREGVFVLDRNGRHVPACTVGHVMVSDELVKRREVNGPGQKGQLIPTGSKGRLLSSGELEQLDLNPAIIQLAQQFYFTDELESVVRNCAGVIDCVILNTPANRSYGEVVCYTILKDETSSIDLIKRSLVALVGEAHASKIVITKVSDFPLDNDGNIDLASLGRMPAMSEATINDITNQIVSTGSVDQLALFPEERTIAEDGKIHIMDFLPQKRKQLSANLVDRNDDQAVPATLEIESQGYLVAPDIEQDDNAPKSVAAALVRNSQLYPANGILYWEAGKREVFQTYASLVDEALHLLKGLNAKGIRKGARVILQIKERRRLLPVFWACIFGGVQPTIVAVPPSYRRKNGVLEKLYNSFTILAPAHIIVDDNLTDDICQVAGAFAFPEACVLRLSEIFSSEKAEIAPGEPDDIVYFQLSSGTTGWPKCIQETNEGIINHAIGAVGSCGFNPQNVSLNWTSLDHVGAVIMFHFKDVIIGNTQIQLATDDFLQRPLVFFDIVEKYKVTHSWSPNFGYKLLSEGIKKSDLTWDLRSLRFILNGGEQVTMPVIDEFLRLTAPFGITEQAIRPAYGMAETCTAVTIQNNFRIVSGSATVDAMTLGGHIKRSDAKTVNATTFISVGTPRHGCEIRIADGENQLLPSDYIGRVQVRTRGKMAGYYKDEAATEKVLLADGWVNTGDLGFISNKELYITGREKEVAIIRGTHLYFHDVERLINDMEGVEPTFAGCCSCADVEATEGLAVFFVSASTAFEFEIEVVKEIRKQVTASYGISPTHIIPIPKDQFPKTTSGKVQRQQLKANLENGEFDDIIKRIELALHSHNVISDHFFRHVWVRKNPRVTRKRVVEHVLVITNDNDFHSALKKELPGVDIIVVSSGCFDKSTDQQYFIDVTLRSDWERLVKSLAHKKPGVLENVLFYWGAGESETQRIAKHQTLGVYSLLYLVQGLNKHYGERTVNICFATHHAQMVKQYDRFIPGQTTIYGFVKSILLERPELSIRTVDIDVLDSVAVAKTIVKELCSSERQEEIAHRAAERFVHKLERLPLAGAHAAPHAALRKKANVLVVGGMGRIGRIICRYLLEDYEATVVIVGQTQLSGQLLTARQAEYADELKMLERLPGKVIYKSLDVADETRIRLLAQELGSEGVAIFDAVIYCGSAAGDVTDHWQKMKKNLCISLDTEAFQPDIRAKVIGPELVNKYFRTSADALIIGMSSVNGFFGAYGFAPYASSCSYLENYMKYLRHVEGKNAWCLSWTIWEEAAGIDNTYKQFIRNKGFKTVSNREGLNTFKIFLNNPIDDLVIGLDELNPFIKRYLKITGGSDPALSAYYSGSAKETEIREAIREVVKPRFDIRAHKIDALPLANGKIDFEKLVEIVRNSGGGQADVFTAKNETEHLLAKAWSEILGQTIIRVQDNFFEKGGDSLKAMMLVERLSKESRRNLQFKDIFQNPSFGDLLEYLEYLGESDGDKLAGSEEQEYYSLSNAQRRLWILSKIDEANIAYNVPLVYELEGALNIPALTRSFELLIERHEILRTRFVEVSSEPKQFVMELNEVPFSIGQIDLRGERNREQSARRLVEEEISSAFNLAVAPLFRVKALQMAPAKTIIVITFHHIVCDGESVETLFAELLRYYNDLTQGTAPILTKAKTQYRDYVRWERRLLTRSSEHREFWKREFKSGIPQIELPIDGSYPSIKRYEGGRQHLALGARMSGHLRTAALENRSSLFSVLLSAVFTFLNKYTHADDLVVGIAVRSKRTPDLKDQIGFFVNTLPLRIQMHKSQTWKQLLNHVNVRLSEVFAHDYPLDLIVEELVQHHDRSRAPLFDVMINFIDNDTDGGAEPVGLKISEYKAERNTSKYFLSFDFRNEPDKVTLELEYNTWLFTSERVQLMLQHFEDVLESCLKAGDVALVTSDWLNRQEKKKLLFDFSERHSSYPKEKSVASLFFEQARLTPDNVALVFGDPVMTYLELAQQVTAFSFQLTTVFDLKPGTVVAMIMDRSEKMIVSILSILNIDCTYLPIGLDNPADRVDYMLSDGGAGLLIVDREERLKSMRAGCRYFAFDSQAIQPTPVTPERQPGSADHPAYIMYTSGSTGRPKGVVVKHHNIVRLIRNTNYTRITSKDRILQLSNYAFDGSVFDIFGALLNGASLITIKSDDLLSTRKFDVFLRTHRPNIMFITTVLFNNMVDFNPSIISLFDKLYFGGEKASFPHVKRAFPYCKTPGSIVNIYGPTECTTFSTYFEIHSMDDRNQVIPIGKPISNCSVYILDSFHQAVPIGVFGEIFIGGEGLAAYWNDKDLQLTSDRFLAGPARSGMVYRTGDVGRWLADGNIEFQGRADSQIKIRGNRVEPHEIEDVVRSVPGVKNAFVIAHGESAAKKLLAFYLADPAVDGEELNRAVKVKLPSYMVPSMFIRVTDMPLTANGKVDQKALVAYYELCESSTDTTQGHDRPKTPMEERIYQAWRHVLGTADIQRDDNFFEIGGHSLMAMALSSVLQAESGVNLTIADMFKYPTIQEQAAFLMDNQTQGSPVALHPIEEQQYYDLSYNQRRIWVIENLIDCGSVYNIPAIFTLKGKLNSKNMEAAVHSLLTDFEILRTVVFELNGKGVQKVLSASEVNSVFEYRVDHGITSVEVEEMIAGWCLSKSPLGRSSLCRFRLVETNHDQSLLFVSLHHIISDGWSMDVVMEELIERYNALSDDQQWRSTLLNLHYKDYVAWQKKILRGNKLKELQQFWQSKFPRVPSKVSIASDFLKQDLPTFSGDSVALAFSEEMTIAIREIARQANATIFVCVLAFVKVLLYRHTELENIVVGTATAGRDKADLKNQIGFFVNEIMIATEISPIDSFRTLIYKVRDAFESSMRHDLYPMDLLLTDLKVKRGFEYSPLADVMVTYYSSNLKANWNLKLSDVVIEKYPLKLRNTKRDLSFVFFESNGSLGLNLEYNTSLFRRESVQMITSQLNALVTNIIDDVDLPIQEISISLENFHIFRK